MSTRRCRSHSRPPHQRDRAERGIPRRRTSWVEWWLHGEFINLKGAKISKSSGGGVLVTDLIDLGYHPLFTGTSLLQAHYRSQVEFSWEAMDSARIGLRRLLVSLHGARSERAGVLGAVANDHLDAFDQAVSDDLNTAKAMAVVTAASRDDSLSDSELATSPCTSTRSSPSA